MPFQSEKQRRFMWAKHPDIAARWTAKYGSKPIRERLTDKVVNQRKR